MSSAPTPSGTAPKPRSALRTVLFLLVVAVAISALLLNQSGSLLSFVKGRKQGHFDTDPTITKTQPMDSGMSSGGKRSVGYFVSEP
jgi:hypothetical protein